MKNHIAPEGTETLTEENGAVKDDPWEEARKIVGTFPEDFMNDRNQPSYEELEKREEF